MTARTYRGVAAVCAEGGHVCTSSARMSAMGDDSKEQSPRRKRSTIASPAKASDHTRPKGLVSRKVLRAADPHTVDIDDCESLLAVPLQQLADRLLAAGSPPPFAAAPGHLWERLPRSSPILKLNGYSQPK